jgi:hypothetical protein
MGTQVRAPSILPTPRLGADLVREEVEALDVGGYPARAA